MDDVSRKFAFGVLLKRYDINQTSMTFDLLTVLFNYGTCCICRLSARGVFDDKDVIACKEA